MKKENRIINNKLIPTDSRYYMNALLHTIRKKLSSPSLWLGIFLVLFVCCVQLAWAENAGGASEIGEQARQRAEEVARGKKSITPEQLQAAEGTVKKVAGLLFVLVLVLFILGARLIKFDPFKAVKANHANGLMFLVFGLFLFGLSAYEVTHHVSASNLFSKSASEHGKDIDSLMVTTMIITGVVFVVVQLVLFWFAFAYRSTPGKKAIFYHDNHKLETIWTVIPAIAIAIMVLFGITIWQNVHHPKVDPNQVLNIEVVGEQFQWRLRYPGQDNKLGKAGFKLLSTDNAIGLDVNDPQAKDDRIPGVKELHVPKGRPVKLNIRSKDVLHGVYLPQFRVNVYAAPGMPTEFNFTPIKTTEEMRKELGNPNFNYEMACSQLCGISHYNMRVVVVVESEEDYQKWLNSQPLALESVSATPEKSLAQTKP